MACMKRTNWRVLSALSVPNAPRVERMALARKPCWAHGAVPNKLWALHGSICLTILLVLTFMHENNIYMIYTYTIIYMYNIHNKYMLQYIRAQFKLTYYMPVSTKHAGFNKLTHGARIPLCHIICRWKKLSKARITLYYHQMHLKYNTKLFICLLPVFY